MKKLLLITLLFLLVCPLAAPALADGFADDAADIRCLNLQFAPVAASSFTEGNIPWYCSATLSPSGDKEWASYYSSDAGRFDRVRVVLYQLIPNIYGNGGMWQSYYTTLSSADYNSLRTVSFSDGGVVYLPAGSYRISLETLWDGAAGENYTTIRSNDFVVNKIPRPTTAPTPIPTVPPTPVPQYATVTLIHRVPSTGQMLFQIDVQSQIGYQTFYPYWGHNEYELISSPNVQLYLYPNGHYYVYFDYAQKVQRPTPVPTPLPTPRPTPKPTPLPTPRPATPVPGQAFDPENPFLYGIKEYDYCLAPEYCVDPAQAPWNYCYLYSKASDINGTNMGKYEKGELVKVIKYNGGNHGKFNYCYVITKDNKLGYMHDYALKPIEESPVYQELYVNNK